ncbi:MAG TPA: PqiC family protein [Candidatus Binataceae bacterium]|nr:PqiC family protein [Candidatus Binataceae bacterium]
MKTKRFVQVQLCALVMLTFGCSILAPVPDRSRFYVLAADPVAPSTASTSRNDLTIGVGPIRIPQYLERTGLATRVGETRVEYSSVDHWAEPLNECFPRVLSRDLGQDLGTVRVVLFPWNRSLHVNYQVEVIVDRFDIDSSNQAELLARWLIKDPSSSQILASGSSNQIRAAGADGASQTGALSQALSGLSSELSKEVRRLQEQMLSRADA